MNSKSIFTIAAFCLSIAPSTTASTIFVDAAAPGGGNGGTWGTAFSDLQDALGAASPGDQVWVAEGTYYPDQGVSVTPGDRAASFQLASGVSVYGSFLGSEATLASRAGSATATILSGDLNQDDQTTGNTENSIHVVGASSVDVTAILDGFTITAGNASFEPFDNDAGALHCSAASPIIRDCRIVGNAASDDGGAVASVSGSDPTFIRCLFLGNESGDVGGAIWSSSSHLTLINCSFFGNDSGRLGGAVYYFGPSNGVSEITGCVFSGNVAADRGGAVYVSSGNSSPHFIGCSFAANQATNTPGGIYSSTATQISSSVIWGNFDPNGASEGSQIGGSTTLGAINHSCIQNLSGVFGGVGNTGGDPKYISVAGQDGLAGTEDDNLRLGQGSSGIDAGDSSSFPADAYDLDGDGNVFEAAPLDVAMNDRFSDDPSVPDTGVGAYPIADMGAYEGVFDSGVLIYGQGCPGTGGIEPTLDMTGVPVAGGTVTLSIANGLPNSISVLLFGLGQSALPVGGGCFLNVTPVLPLMLSIPLGPAGSASLPGNIPPGTTGLSFTMQAFVDEPLLLKPFSNTKGLQLTVQ